MNQWTRRDFFRVAAVAPAAGASLLHWDPRGEDRCLLVVELVGGNDGLNTLIPTEESAYHDARPSLSSVAKGAHAIADGYALHPSMRGLHDLFQREEAAAIHAVGYPKPDRSHFRSRDIWHTADPELERANPQSTGWLGRTADWLAKRGAEVPALGIGAIEVPLALQGRDVIAPALRRIEDYALLVDRGGDAAAERARLAKLVDDAGAGDDLTDFVRDVAKSSVANSKRMREALDGYRARAEYPDGEFGRALQLTARVLVSGFGTRLFWVPLDGFDTHARQAPTHTGLMNQLSGGLDALCADLRAHGLLDRVAILVHSEFGRRVAENKSQGTDHGAAAPVFVIGGGVRHGVHGTAPSLRELDDGDLIASTDFRSVYAELVSWLGAPAREIVGEVPAELRLFAR